MKDHVRRLGVFFRNLRMCMAEAKRDCDSWYHIPKSRFRDNGGDSDAERPAAPKRKVPAKNYFLGSFRDCVLSAWEASDSDYHLPKSRFMDREFNRSAYGSEGKPGFWGHVLRFLGTLKDCISVSWEASGTFYNLPKSRYQEADFIREIMHVAPEPRGRLLHRPYTIGFGVVVGDESGGGWTIPSREERADEMPFALDAPTGQDPMPEMEM